MTKQSKIRVLTAIASRRALYTAQFGALFIAAWLVAFSAAAQMPAAEDEAKLRALYEELLLNPADVDKTLEYSAHAADMKDFEAAIPPLERLLLSYPNANKIKLELSQLYAKLGAADVAASYLNQVKNDASADAADLQLAEQYLAAMKPEAK